MEYNRRHLHLIRYPICSNRLFGDLSSGGVASEFAVAFPREPSDGKKSRTSENCAVAANLPAFHL
jgi:hypothetical protein